MACRSSICAVTLVVLIAIMGVVGAADDSRYPSLKGQWLAINPPLGDQIIKFDPTKRSGPWQQAPLTPEYQKVLEDSMADQAKGVWQLSDRPLHPGRHAAGDGGAKDGRIETPFGASHVG